MQEVPNPIRKKPQEVTSPTANRKYPQEFHIVRLTGNEPQQ